MDDLTKIAREADARWEPQPGDKVRVGRFTRLVMERHDKANCTFENAGLRCPELDCAIIYIESEPLDGGSFNSRHRGTSLIAWRSWARMGREVT